MNRRTFLQLLALAVGAPLWYRQPAQAAPIDTQFVFDGGGGLTFPATATRHATPSATTLTRFRALSFFEKLMEVLHGTTIQTAR